MTKLDESNIIQILPDIFTKKPDVIALGYAISQEIRRLITYCSSISVYAVIDTLPDDILDMLAAELDTQHYDTSLDISAKRRLIKNTMVWYMTAGTPAAVEELVAAAFGEGEVKEWFEYGDEPYYFKIVTNATLTPEINDTFSTIIRRVKNARSHIRAIDIHRTAELGIYAIVSQQPVYKPPMIIDGYSTDSTARLTGYGVTGERGVSHPAAIADGYNINNTAHLTEYGLTAEHGVSRSAAVADGTTITADSVTADIYQGAAIYGTQKQTATEAFVYNAKTITQATSATAAADSRYKSIITE